MSDNNILLRPYLLNHILTLKNRIVMAPMTRAQADHDFVPTKMMADYYGRRANAGLIITEGTIISPEARGHHRVPGIFNENQIEKWKWTTDAVHQSGGLIFMQIWHVGRVSHPDFLGGKFPISASETTMTSRVSRSDGLFYGKSRAATVLEIQILIDQYAMAAKNAIQAGFDGVEIHGANGYLIDQFLHHDTNKRLDEYGGNSEYMARFALEVVRACGLMIGYERVGLRLSPGAYLNEIVGEKRDAEVFKYLLESLNDYSIAYVHTGSFDDTRTYAELENQMMTAFIRSHYQGTVVACGGYTVEKAQVEISKGNFDLVAMGRPFIANPDLIERIAQQKELKNYDVSMLNSLY